MLNFSFLNYIVGAALVASTFFLKISLPVDIKTGHQVYFIFSSFIILLVSRSKVEFTKESASLFYFVVAAFFLPENIYNSYSFFQWLLTSLGIIVYLKLRNEKLDRKILEKFFVFICLFQCAWVFIDALGFDIYGAFLSTFLSGVKRVTSVGQEWASGTNKRIIGSLGHSTLSGAFLAALTPFVYKFKKYLAIIPVLALYLLDSTMSVLGLAAASVYFFTYNFKHRKKILSLWAVFIASLFTYGVKHGGYFSDSNRVKNWTGIIKEFGAKSPFFGNGVGFLENQNFKISAPAETFRIEHNELLTLYFQYGLIGLAIACVFFHSLIIRFKLEKDIVLKASLIAILFNSMGSFPLHISAIGFLTIILTSQLGKQGV